MKFGDDEGAPAAKAAARTTPGDIWRNSDWLSRSLSANHSGAPAVLSALPPPQKPDTPQGLMPRIVTYNVHRCVGSDRRLDVGRVAQVLAELEPDIVALQ